MPSQSKHIGLYSWDFIRPKGGLGRAMQWLKEGLENGGWRVSVCTKDQSIWNKHHMLFSLFSGRRLSAWIKAQHIRTVLLPIGPGGIFLYKKPEETQLIGIVYHTYAQQASSVPGEWWKRIFIPFERRTMRMCDRIFCYSEDTYRSLQECYGIEKQMIELLPQIFDVNDWLTQEDPKKDNACICVARLDSRKGVDCLLAAWQEVRERKPDAKLTVVGTGIQEKEVDAASGVVRVPKVSRRKLRAMVRTSVVALCPSYLEGFGLAAAEAMAAGTVVVASDVDGLRSLVSSETGVLVENNNPQVLAESIVSILDDPKRRTRLGNNARRHIAKRFNRTHAEKALQEALMSL